MELTKISFCKGSAYNIKNNRQKSDILQSIQKKYKLSINDLSFLNYGDKLIKNMCRYPHLMSTITFGNKYWLYLTKIKNENYSIFIDKKILEGHKFPKMIIINTRFDDHIFKDTLFNGELIKDRKGNWEFIIDKLLVNKGKTMYQKTILENIREMYSIFKNNYVFDANIQTCRLSIKKYFGYDKIDELTKNFIPSCSYKIAGINFHPIIARKKSINFYFKNIYRQNNHSEYLRFLDYNKSLENSIKEEKRLLAEVKEIENKPEIYDDAEILSALLDNINDEYNENDKQFTFSMKAVNLPNIFILSCIKNNDLQKHSIARIDTIECAEYANNLFEKRKEVLVDCEYCPEFKKWIPNEISNNQISSFRDIENYAKKFS